MGTSGHTAVPFPAPRRLVAASSAVGRTSNSIHIITEVDVEDPRRLIREYRATTGESLSFTAYVITCLGRALAEQPELNALRSGRRLVQLDDVTINTLVEREIEGRKVPEPYPIPGAARKSFRQVHEAVREAQRHESDGMGTLSGSPWFLRLLPEAAARWFIRFATRNIALAKRYGVVTVTAVGMFGSGAAWAIPLTAATITLTVGSIVRRPVFRDGDLENREHLCLTVSFNHDIVDGAPAARFLKRLAEILSAGDVVHEATY